MNVAVSSLIVALRVAVGFCSSGFMEASNPAPRRSLILVIIAREGPGNEERGGVRL